MIVNKCLVFIISLTIVICLTNGYKMGIGTIREENGYRPVYLKRNSALLQGNNNINKNNLNDENSKPSGSSSSKSFTSKEFVYGDDDDDESKNSKSNSKSVKEQEIPVAEILMSDDDKLSRNQRTDKLHPQHKDYSNYLYKLHRSPEFQRKLLQEQENRYDFDYDILRKLLIKESDLFENEMRAKELIGVSHHKTLDDIFEEYLENARKVDLNTMKKHNKHQNSNPVNSVEMKEKIYLEDEYNNKFKSASPKTDIENVAENMNEMPNNIVPVEEPKPESNVVKSNQNLKQHSKLVDSSEHSQFEMIKKQNDYLLIFVVAGCSIAGVVAIVAAGICWYTVHKSAIGTIDGGKGTFFDGFTNSAGRDSVKSKTSNSSGDRRLAQSAQMYHYQHQKQQMIAMEKANNDTKPDNSDNSDGETEEGDYTVYECPGLAPTGEMEVKNPLFKEDFGTTLPSSVSINSMPPAYSSVSQTPQSPKDEVPSKTVPTPSTSQQKIEQPSNQQENANLIDISTSNQTTTSDDNKPSGSVLITINDASSSDQKQ